MRCTDPRTVSFLDDGKTLTWSQKKRSKQFASFQLPCGQCLQCRLEYARQWAVRCVHEAQMHPNNVFITLTYDEENLKSPKLQYADFQLFAKRLRDKIHRETIDRYGKYNWSLLDKEERKKLSKQTQIGYFVTGEYGEENKRPHWHAIIFNWRPSDAKKKYTNHRGDVVYESETLTNLWGKGQCDFGSVTFESAGYVARYAAKKLTHGKDGEHDYQPISKKSIDQAIGKSWLEKYFWSDCFNRGEIVLRDGSSCAIPRYYEKWLKKHKPDLWLRYVTNEKSKRTEKAFEQQQADHAAHLKQRNSLAWNHPEPVTKLQMQKAILESRFEFLQSKLKL